MKLLSLTPNLMVENVNESVKFYNKILGFSTFQTVPEAGELEWAMITKDEISIMFQKTESLKNEYPELKNQKGGGALTFYINTSNIDEFYNKIKNNVNIIRDLHKTPYSANEFSISDPNGFILVFSDILE